MIYPYKIAPCGSMRGRRFCSMKIPEDVRKYATEQGIPAEDVLKIAMGKKSREFVEKGAQVYAKAKKHTRDPY